jgi:hypothetical protein
MNLNPYARFLGKLDPLEVIAETPGRLSSILDTLGTEGADRPPAPGKWSAREIFCHLTDCELAFAFRLRQALAETDHVIQPFDQDRWAAVYSVPAFDANMAIDVFAAVRAWNMRLIASLSKEALAKAVTHPERGTMTVQTIVETMGGHDRNHLAQLEAIVEKTAAA